MTIGSVRVTTLEWSPLQIYNEGVKKIFTRMDLNVEDIKPLVELALREDIGEGDITSNILVPSGCKAKGLITVKGKGIVAGLSVAELVFKTVDSAVEFTPLLADGKKVEVGECVAEVVGMARAILAGERTALNFLGRLSGIATKTAGFVKKVSPYNTKIMDTRKTTPGWRMLEKYAVRAGGGYNHRMGLYDAVLIKDNHLKIVKVEVADVVKEMRAGVPASIKIEVEVENVSELEAALSGEPDIIMLDNMSVNEVKKAVEVVRKSGCNVQVEVSGGITLENVEEYANTGVDMISIGALTHSVHSLDVSMEME